MPTLAEMYNDGETSAARQGMLLRQADEGLSDYDKFVQTKAGGVGLPPNQIAPNPDGTGNYLLTFKPGDSGYDSLMQSGQAKPDASGNITVPSNIFQGLTGSGRTSMWQVLRNPVAFAAFVASAGTAGAYGAGGEAVAGSAFPVGGEAAFGAGTYAGGGAAAGGAGAASTALPESYWSMTAEAPGAVTDTGAVNAGTLADATYTIPEDVGAGYDAAYGDSGMGGIGGGGGGAQVPLDGGTRPAPAGTSMIPGIPNNVLAGGLQGLLGYAGANQQSNALTNFGNQQSAIGQPYRDLLLQSYQPGFDLRSQPGYGDAFNRMADVATRQWSPRGDPANNPGIQGGILDNVWNQGYVPTLNSYRGGLGQAGGMGLNMSGNAGMANAANAGAGLNAIGYGINTALNPQPTLADLINGTRNNQTLTVGGNPYR